VIAPDARAASSFGKAPGVAKHRPPGFDPVAGYAIPELLISTPARAFSYLPEERLRQPAMVAYLAELARRQDAGIIEAGRIVAARMSEARIRPRGASIDSHAYLVTLGQAYFIVLSRWQNAVGTGARRPVHPSEPGGLEAVEREHFRIVETAERRYHKTLGSLDAPIALQEGEVTMADFIAATALDPGDVVAGRELVDLREALSLTERVTLRKIILKSPIQGEADKKRRYRLRRKIKRVLSC
jgi:hypothetical protein